MESVVGTVGDSDGHLLVETINKTGLSFLLVEQGEKEDYIWLHKVWKRVSFKLLHFSSFSRCTII
jgi:hypothetical protein